MNENQECPECGKPSLMIICGYETLVWHSDSSIEYCEVDASSCSRVHGTHIHIHAFEEENDLR